MVACNHLVKFTISGIVLIAIGFLVNFALPPLIGLYINKQLRLEPGSETYPMWRELPVPVYQRFYFFNVTNAQDVEQRGSKPLLEEIGPFTYRTEFDKRDIELDSDKNTLAFRQFKTWHFEPELSIEDHKLVITTINAPLAITLTLIQSASNAVRLLVTFSLDGLSDGFFTRRSIKQLLFEGYPDLLTTFGPLLNSEMLSQGGYFGYMNARNNSLDGAYEINTGTDDIGKLNTLASFNGRPELSYWHKSAKGGASANTCNSFSGATTGELFPPLQSDYLQNDTTCLRLFQPDLCRTWRLDLEGGYEETGSGLFLTRFTATRDIFKNSTDLPENACFFHSHSKRTGTHTNHNGASGGGDSDKSQEQQHNSHNRHNSNRHGLNRVKHEWPAGVFTLSPCKFNAPIYVSMPHFLDADPYFKSQVDGLEPNKDKHEFYLDLEPRTGSPVLLAARVQVNIAISKPPGLVRFRNIPEIMFPIFWQEVVVNVTNNRQVVEQLLLASRRVGDATQSVAFSFIFLGAFILITTALFYLNVYRHTLTAQKK